MRNQSPFLLRGAAVRAGCLALAASALFLWIGLAAPARAEEEAPPAGSATFAEQDIAPPAAGAAVEEEEGDAGGEAREVLERAPAGLRAATPQEEGVLSVESTPSGVSVFVDGEDRGVTPLKVRGLSDAAHEVILYHPQHGTFSQKVEGGSGRIFVDLKAGAGMGVGFVDIRTTPRDVRVDLDGRRVGMTPLKMPVVSGKHTLLLSRDGYVDQQIVVEVGSGETALVEHLMAEKEGALLVITSPSGAEVFLDGVSVGVAVGPLRIAKIPPGTHAVRIAKEGFVDWSRDNVAIAREKTETILAALHPATNECNVRIYSDPEGARVWLDGQEIGVAGPDGLGFNTTKGAHILRMEVNPAIRPGYRPLQTSISFNEDMVDYRGNPVKLPVIDDAFLSAQKLYERGEGEQAIAFLDRVSPQRTSYAESRIMMVDILKDLRRLGEIPGEFEKLFAQPLYQKNPVLNLAMGFWAIQASRQSTDADAAKQLAKAIAALDRCVESVDYFPAEERQVLALKAHYYTGIAAEILFGVTGDKRNVKKGVQAWEMFFARLGASDETLGNDWVEKAKRHRKNLLYLEKKLGG